MARRSFAQGSVALGGAAWWALARRGAGENGDAASCGFVQRAERTCFFILSYLVLNPEVVGAYVHSHAAAMLLYVHNQ